jgi:aliphatic nitrilase
MAEGEQVHISTYPPIWPTRPPSEKGAYDLRRAIEIRAGAHAFEAKVFNIVSSGFADRALKDAISGDDHQVRETIENSPQSVSMILDPSGNSIGQVLSEEEGIVYAEVDTALSVEPKQFHDVVGYYNRFDIFDLKIDRTKRDPATFLDDSSHAATELNSGQAAEETRSTTAAPLTP